MLYQDSASNAKMGYSVQVLDLFSGIGGFSLGLKRAGMETIGFCEIDPFCRKVLTKHWPDVPIHTDIRGLDGKDYKGRAEIICGGFPCQPFSQAGKRRGTEDDRHLWPEMLRVISEDRPTWVIGENVIGFVKMELDSVLSDLEREGYQTRAFIIPACGVDAPHKRDRVWIIAHANGEGESDGPINEGPRPRQLELMAYSLSKRGCSRDTKRQDAKNVGQPSRCEGDNSRRVETWNPEPGVGRVANGVSNRVDRVKGLGNAVVPMVVEVIGNAIMEI